MISVCIIEDEKGQYEMIRNCLVRINESIQKSDDYSCLEFEIKDVRCWELELEKFKSNYLKWDVDLLFLDHGLEWDGRKTIWNGDKVLQFIKENTPEIEIPYILYTSDKVDKSATESKKVFSFFKRKPGDIQIHYDSIGKEYFMDSSAFQDLEKMIVEKLKIVFSRNPYVELPYYKYPDSNSFMTSEDFKWSVERRIKINGSNVVIDMGPIEQPVRFYQKNIITFFVGNKDLYCLLYILDNEILLTLINMKRRIIKSEVIELLQSNGISNFIQSNGLIYNPAYLNVVENAISFNKKNLEKNIRIKIKSILQEKLQESYAKNNKHVGSRRNKINDINPFASTFERFFENHELEEMCRKK